MTIRADQGMSYKFDQFTIDVDDERLLGPRGPIKVGRKALRVLLVLAAHPGRLVTKDMLFSTVWDRTIVSDCALTSVVKELRRALDDPAHAPRFIQCVYGRGYRFLAEVTAVDTQSEERLSCLKNSHEEALERSGDPLPEGKLPEQRDLDRSVNTVVEASRPRPHHHPAATAPFTAPARIARFFKAAIGAVLFAGSALVLGPNALHRNVTPIGAITASGSEGTKKGVLSGLHLAAVPLREGSVGFASGAPKEEPSLIARQPATQFWGSFGPSFCTGLGA